ncbi:hypothetical protein BDV06DRAFT_217610 [Aspergillus oleicola]
MPITFDSQQGHYFSCLIPLASLGQSLSISLPPLIPRIPAVTEALNNIVPPLSISDIKPKEIGYSWTGFGDKQHKNSLATYSLDDDTFATLICITDRPRHPLLHDRRDPRKARMGSALGTSPGCLVETDAEFNIIHVWPEGVDGLLNVLGEQFSPSILTSGFVVPISILKPSTGIQRANTLRVWDLDHKHILSTITIPDMNVKFIPGNKEGAALVHLGQVWIVYPKRKDKHGNPGVAKLLYDLGPKAAISLLFRFFSTNITQDGKYIYLTLTTANHIAALDISDLKNVKRLGDPDEDQPSIGPHYIKALYIDLKDDGRLSLNRTIKFSRMFANRGGTKPYSIVVFNLSDLEDRLYYSRTLGGGD